MDGEDPWFWDVDRIVLELCTNQRSWTPTTATRRMPNPVMLEKAIRGEEIDGSTLLTEVDESVLEHRLGVKVFGQLAAVKQVIRDLRRMSQQYVIWKNKYGSEIFLASHVAPSAISASNIRRRSESPPFNSMRQVASPLSPAFEHKDRRDNSRDARHETPDHPASANVRNLHEESWITDVAVNKRRRLHLTHSEEHSELAELYDDSGVKSRDENQSAGLPIVARDGQNQGDFDVTAAAISATNNRSSAGDTVLSKKRKRIAPTLITSTIDADRSRDIPTQADVVIHNDPQNIEPGVIYVGNDGKKRLVPISLSRPDLELPRTHQEQLRQLASTNLHALQQGGRQGFEAAEKVLKAAKEKEVEAIVDNLSTGYLGKKKHSVDDVFYNGITIGMELSSADTDHELMRVFHGDISDGRRLYIHGLMKRYLRSERQIICRNGKYFSAIRPYAARLAQMHHVPSFTLFSQETDGTIHATREDLMKWPEVDPNASPHRTASARNDNERQAHFDLPDNLILGGPSSYDDWDPNHLEKYRYIDGGDTVLPLYGDSDEEGEYDLETWNEIEEERGTLEKPLLSLKKRQITKDDVNAAIDEGIAEIVVKWNKEKLPKRQLQAWKLWKKSRCDGSKRRRIREAQQHVDRINNERLPKMREEILLEIWTSKKQVHKQTRIMEQSVFDREDLVWQISTLDSKVEPEKPLPPDTTPFKSKKSANLSDGLREEAEESIGTETDVQSSYDGLDDFIISDQAEALSAEEGEQRRADDEADDYAMSNTGNSSDGETDRSKQGSKIIAKVISKTRLAPLNPKGISANPIPDIGDHAVDDFQGIHDEPMTDVFTGHVESSTSPRIEMSSSPLHPLSPEAVIEKIEPEHNPPKLSAGTINASKRSMPDIVDLTQLTSETSAGEGSSQPSNIINLVTPDKRKNKINLVIKREKASPDQIIQISDSDGPPLPVELPPYTNPTAIANYRPVSWQKAGDRNRLLISIVHTMGTAAKSQLRELFTGMSKDQIWSGMVDVMQAIHGRDDRVRGMDPKTYMSLTGVVRLFQIYSDCLERSHKAALASLSSSVVVEGLKGNHGLFSTFYELCCQSLNGHVDKGLKMAVVDDHDSDSDPLPAVRRKSRALTASDTEELEHHAPHKLRKKKVFENVQARDLREQDRQRLREQDERRKVLQLKLAESGSGLNADRARIIINDAKHDDQGFVYINEQIGKRIKDHQIDGIRFMWSQIVTNERAMQGCLLAHTMGLGKTMQVITLLVAIAEAARSSDKSVSSQIPPSLRVSKTLILCPPGLIDNWMDELLTWAPEGVLGDFRKVDSATRYTEARLNVIDSWYDGGGILIMGYEMFRALIHNKATAKRLAPLDDKEHAQVLKQLVQGPNIIVADEAHKMKNARASITQAATQFRSRSRIALTGSPLANNVEEYHTMIEWVAPNYLGPIVEFRAKYVEPIQQGLWYDSTAYEKKQSLKMLGVLKEDLSPKVHRADMSVLRNDLEPKTEFVITVPLTDLQHKAYSLYVEYMQGKSDELTKGGQLQQTTLWHWLAILSLLCNHPECFKLKLSERREDARKGTEAKSKDQVNLLKDSTSDEEPIAGAAPVWKVGVSGELIRREMELFESFGSAIDAFENSNKVRILLQILDASRAVGDKVLIFSQSIPTLNYLEAICKRTRRDYARLDGKTKMSTRQGLTKQFNTGSTELYLISTTAGGLGLNLPGANRVIIFDFRWNPTNEEQAVGRAYRIGQQKPVFVYRFVVGGTFEESIHNKAVFKMQLASRVVDKKNPVAWAKRNLGEFLFEPKPVKQKDLSSFRGMDPHVLDKILDRQDQDSDIRAIVVTDTFERHDNDMLTAEEQKEVRQLVSEEQLKRSNPRAWRALVQKRSQEAQAKLLQMALAARAQITPAQLALVDGSTVSTVPSAQYAGQTGNYNHAVDRPVLPGDRPTVSSVLPPSDVATMQSTFASLMPEMTPIAGANTKIRAHTPSADDISPASGVEGLSSASILTLSSGMVINGNSAGQASAGPKSLTSALSDTSNSMLRCLPGKIAEARDSVTPDTGTPEMDNPQAARPSPSRHNLSLSGTRSASEAAEGRLRVAITQAHQNSDYFLPPVSKYSELSIANVASSIRQVLEQNDSRLLAERSQDIAEQLAQDSELVERLLSGELTPDDFTNLKFPTSSDGKAVRTERVDKPPTDPIQKPILPAKRTLSSSPSSAKQMAESAMPSTSDSAYAPGHLKAMRNPIVSVDKRGEFILKFKKAIQAALAGTTKAGETPLSDDVENLINKTASDVCMKLATTTKDSSAFEAAAEVALKEVQSEHEICQQLINENLTYADFVRRMTARLTQHCISGVGRSSDNSKRSSGSSPSAEQSVRSLRTSLPKRSKDPRKEVLRSPQAKADKAYLGKIAARRRSQSPDPKQQLNPITPSPSPAPARPAKLPKWALSDIEKANTGNSSQRSTPHVNIPPSRKQSHTPSST